MNSSEKNLVKLNVAKSIASSKNNLVAKVLDAHGYQIHAHAYYRKDGFLIELVECCTP